MVTAAVQDQICEVGSFSLEPGTRLALTLSEDVAGDAGARAKRGDAVYLRVDRRRRAAAASDPPELTLYADSVVVNGAPRSIASEALRIYPTEISRGPSAAKLTIGGALAGAAVGYLVRRDARGAIIGAAVGGAAGQVASAKLTGHEWCLEKGKTLSFRLRDPLVVR